MPSVREMRLQSGLSQPELAEAAGVERSRYTRHELGQVALRPEEEARVRKVLEAAILARTVYLRLVETVHA